MNIKNYSDFNKLISESDAIAVLFGAPDCNVCNSVKPVLFEMIESNFPKIITTYIDIKDKKEISACLQIFSIPVLIIYLSGKEVMRKVRIINVGEVCDELERPYSLMFK